MQPKDNDAVDEIIELVARWVKPNVDMDALRKEKFYGAVRQRIEELIEGRTGR